jgi:hypothetical protein
MVNWEYLPVWVYGVIVIVVWYILGAIWIRWDMYKDTQEELAKYKEFYVVVWAFSPVIIPLYVGMHLVGYALYVLSVGLTGNPHNWLEPTPNGSPAGGGPNRPVPPTGGSIAQEMDTIIRLTTENANLKRQIDKLNERINEQATKPMVTYHDEYSKALLSKQVNLIADLNAECEILREKLKVAEGKLMMIGVKVDNSKPTEKLWSVVPQIVIDHITDTRYEFISGFSTPLLKVVAHGTPTRDIWFDERKILQKII